jgi:hypothetical protein
MLNIEYYYIAPGMRKTPHSGEAALPRFRLSLIKVDFKRTFLTKIDAKVKVFMTEKNIPVRGLCTLPEAL